MDSLTQPANYAPGVNNLGDTWQTSHCSAITKKGTPCKRKATSNGYCWQHRK
jgi:hypothetical protein